MCACVCVCVCVYIYIYIYNFPGGSVGKESACNAGDQLQCKRSEFEPWARKIRWRRKWQPTPVLWPGKFHGERSLSGYSPRGHKSLT